MIILSYLIINLRIIIYNVIKAEIMTTNTLLQTIHGGKARRRKTFVICGVMTRQSGTDHSFQQGGCINRVKSCRW